MISIARTLREPGLWALSDPHDEITYQATSFVKEEVMDFASIIGILSGLFLIVAAILMKGDLTNFFNVAGLMIVLGGTTAATLLTFPLKDVLKAFQAAFFVLYERNTDPNRMVETMIKLSKISRRRGLTALSKMKTNNPILKKGCNLISDGAEEEIIRNALRIEIDSLKHRHLNIQDIFIKMATFSPAFGMIGTLIGLVQMLQNMEDPSSIGPAMAIALLTTFYGAVMANIVCIPLSGKLKARSKEEVLTKEMTVQGIMSLSNGDNPRILEQKLKAFMPANNDAAS